MKAMPVEFLHTSLVSYMGKTKNMNAVRKTGIESRKFILRKYMNVMK